ncbi:MAG: hypothetical protein D6679_08765 [Candidatus Hydrogenedentota bacterium]|nr:MAG: hypothetical protein D6679_08765 [Candidatus Hydrogenedentota bacterium]
MSSAAIVGLLGLAAIILFMTERFPNEIVALGLLVALALTRVLDLREAFSGFSHASVITIGAFLVLSEALVKTGAVSLLARHLFQTTAPRRILAIVLAVVAFSSAWISNTALVALFIPILYEVSREKNIPASRLFLPLGFAALIGGTFTVIGNSSMIFGAALYKDITGSTIPFFAPLRFSLFFFLLYATYLLFFAHARLPLRPEPEGIEMPLDVREFLAQARVLPGSPLIGQPATGSYVQETYDWEIVALRRGNRAYYRVPPELTLQAGDLVLFRAEPELVATLANVLHLEVEPEVTLQKEGYAAGEMEFAEVMVGPQYLNHPVSETRLREKFGASVLAVWRRGRLRRRRVNDILLLPGDVLVLLGGRGVVNLLEKNRDFILRREHILPMERLSRLPIAVLTMLAVLVTGVWGVIPLPLAALTGAVCVVLTGCLTPREMRTAVNWNMLLLIAGLIPFSIAFRESGLADRLAETVAASASLFGPRISLAVILVVASLLGQFVQPNGAVAIVLPLACSTAQALGVDPMPFVMAVLYAAIYTFITPYSYTVNIMIASAGNYRARDFVRHGIGLLLLFYILGPLFLPILFPF